MDEEARDEEIGEAGTTMKEWTSAKLCGVVFLMACVATGAQSGAPAKPVRINRAIQMLEQGQPVYYTQTSGGGYEEGKKLAQTPSDYITYDMEHGAYDMAALRAFMRGLVDGGPDADGSPHAGGHRHAAGARPR